MPEAEDGDAAGKSVPLKAFCELIENLPSMVFVTSAGRLVYVNRRVIEIMGGSREDYRAEDLDFRKMIAPDSLEVAQEGYARRMKGQLNPPAEIGVIAASGERLDVMISSKQVELEGRPAIVSVVADITERKRTERELKETQKLYRTLLKAFPDAVTMTDMEGRIIEVSESAVEIAGCDGPEDLLGKTAFEFIAPEDRERAIEGLRRTLSEQVMHGAEYRLLRKDGSSYMGELDSALVLDASGQPKGFIATVRDITERKRVEEERARLQEQLRQALGSTEHERDLLAIEVASLRSQMKDHYGLDNMVGQDAKMRAIYETILAVSGTRATVLIQGETGTGKELVARAVHSNSPPSCGGGDRPFVKVDCGALAENLLESELFGHVRGAFTGAVRDRRGRFELADTGTIFLDEIQNLSMPLQSKLLRVVQEGCFEKVGGTETRRVDVRVIASTNEDPEEMLASGRLRKDLYYRLNVVPIRLPPLRERREDVPLLALHFMKRMSDTHGKSVTRITKEAVDRLAAHEWPGNVRELENIIEQAVVFAQDETIRKGDIRLPESGAGPHRLGVRPAGEGTPGPAYSAEAAPAAKAGRPPHVKGVGRASAEAQTRAIREALRRTGGNKKRAAELLGISRSALYEKLKRYGIEKSGA